jgi:hypothetical protein
MEIIHPFTGRSIARAVTKVEMFRWTDHCIAKPAFVFEPKL